MSSFNKSILAFAILSFSSSVLAQTLNIVSPSSSVVVPEGDEFASDELSDAWDFDDRRDIGWEEGMNEATVKANSGIWSGNTSTGGAYIFPLFPGLKGTLYAEGAQSDQGLPKLGINHRVDANKYKWLSFRASLSSRTQIALYWDADDLTCIIHEI